jgi:hypothetical protein
MPDSYNLYCDESCHLENDKNSAIAWGAVYCETEKYKEISDRIRSIKKTHGLSCSSEIKWTKVGPAKIDYYLALVDYFFDCTDLFFRGLVVADKSVLNHEAYSQTHEDWYWKMYYTMLIHILPNNRNYRIFLDIKDAHSNKRSGKLKEVLHNSNHDFNHNIVKKLQIIRSHESEIMQLTDLFIGALTYLHRGLRTSVAKQNLIRRMQGRSKYTLTQTTPGGEQKFNILVWESRNEH